MAEMLMSEVWIARLSDWGNNFIILPPKITIDGLPDQKTPPKEMNITN
jgi:hypothetical protein